MSVNIESICDEFKSYINTNFQGAQSILLFCEDHTRNAFYLENIYQLSAMIKQAGFDVTICSYFNDHPDICNSTGYLQFKTANDNDLIVHCLYYLIDRLDQFKFDLCLLNNDLTNGDLAGLNQLDIPIVPHLI